MANAPILTSVPPRTLAAVVTYNPDGDLSRNLAALAAQFDAVVVIDNGSANGGFVRAAANSEGCRLIECRENLGVAAALNKAVALARAEGFGFLGTFDQDSLFPPSALSELLAVYAAYPAGNRPALVATRRRDRGTGRDYHLFWDILRRAPDWTVVRSSITSGSVHPVDVFDEVGLFDERLFIDSVDHDWCLRARSKGFDLVESRRAVLDHAIGASARHSLLGLPVITMNQPPTRRYYITRNQTEVARRYFLFDPVWCAAALALLLAGIALMLIFEADRRAKLAAVLEGARDFALRRFGQRRISFTPHSAATGSVTERR
jgi:rhamnosyltransferase